MCSNYMLTLLYTNLEFHVAICNHILLLYQGRSVLITEAIQMRGRSPYGRYGVRFDLNAFRENLKKKQFQRLNLHLETDIETDISHQFYNILFITTWRSQQDSWHMATQRTWAFLFSAHQQVRILPVISKFGWANFC